MTDDDVMDHMHGKTLTAREIARQLFRAEDAIARRLRLLIAQGLVEEGPRRDYADGCRGQPMKTYQLKRTRKTA